jgi:TonB family protein
MSRLSEIATFIFVFLAVVLQVNAGSDDLPNGKIFRSGDDQESIKIISSNELELTNGRTGPHLVGKYSKENESLRVVATVLGTAQALYFKVTEQGIQSDDGTVFYDPTHFEEANRTVKLEAEARRKAIIDSNIVRASPTPVTRLPGPMSISAAKALAVSTPRPEYPMEARSRHITGSGVAVLLVDVPTGVVTDARMEQSIGNPILDNAAVSAFRRWRFKPGTTSQIRIPITYTMTGASY